MSSTEPTECQEIAKDEAQSLESHFLRIPIEIRLSIYRYLLLPRSSLNLEELCARRDRYKADKDGWVTEDTDSDSYTDSEVDSDLTPGHDFTDCDCLGCFSRRVDEPDSDDESSHWSNEDTNEYSVFWTDDIMHMEILRVNRQIHAEASSLMYSELEVVVGSDDILCLGPPQPNTPIFGIDFDYERTPNVLWRHNPLKGTGKMTKGVPEYKKMANIDGEGRLDPHVFARFAKIKFEIYITDDQMFHDEEMWFDEESLIFNHAHATEYQTRIQQLPLVKDFVKIISHSTLITHLSITLTSEVLSNSSSMALNESYQDSDAGDIDDDAEYALVRKAEEMEDLANKKATELMITSTLLDPLAKLSNVRNIKFDFDFVPNEWETSHKPSPETVARLAGLKFMVESKFVNPLDTRMASRRTKRKHE